MNRWQEYERRKRDLLKQNLSEADYQKAIKALLEELGL